MKILRFFCSKTSLQKKFFSHWTILEFLKPLKGFLQYIVESRNISIAVSPKTLTDQITSRTSIVPLLIVLEEFRRQPYA